MYSEHMNSLLELAVWKSTAFACRQVKLDCKTSMKTLHDAILFMEAINTPGRSIGQKRGVSAIIIMTRPTFPQQTGRGRHRIFLMALRTLIR
jgi:hypothetical protein